MIESRPAIGAYHNEVRTIFVRLLNDPVRGTHISHYSSTALSLAFGDLVSHVSTLERSSPGELRFLISNVDYGRLVSRASLGC